MKILISGIDSGGFGGSEKFLFHLSKALIYYGNTVSFCQVKNSSFYKFLKAKKINSYTIPFRMDIIGGIKGFIKYFLFLIPCTFINKIMIKHYVSMNYDVIILSGFTDKILLTKISHMVGIKVIWIEYADLNDVINRNFGIPKLLYKKSLKYVDLLVVPTNYTKNRLITVLNKNIPIKVIPCGIELLPKNTIKKYQKNKFKVRKLFSINKDSYVIGSVSRIQKEKGQDELIRTLSILKKDIKKLKLVIVGEGDISELKSYAKKLKIDQDVIFAGFVKDVYKIISSFDVFVFPTRWEMEGFGIVPLEAMQVGIPVVASNFGPVPLVLGDSACLCKPYAKDIVQNILLIYKNKNISKILNISASEKVKQYDIKKIAKEYITEINNIK